MNMTAAQAVQPIAKASPLQVVQVLAPQGAAVEVADGRGQVYARVNADECAALTVAGALGTHTIRARSSDGKLLSESTFDVDAQTQLADSGGTFAQAMEILNKTMRCYDPSGVGKIQYRGQTYKNYVVWILDHVHTAKGMYYFADATAGLVDLFRKVQKSDGMIWSFCYPHNAYYMDAYGPAGYCWHDDGKTFARQPVENHNEYNFVDGIYLAWKASGDDRWLAETIDAGIKALDYSVNSPVRFSNRFGLLKRGNTIDSWDFQAHDAYLVQFRLASEQMIHPEKTKFVIFHGDNQGYALACDQMVEMLTHLGRVADAEKFRQRAADIRSRLDKIAWNGRFFRHHVEEDDTVKRDLGVDESTQFAMSNCYALNRGVTHEQAKAILETYLNLKANLPDGSPGEWYAIYPPYGKGFGKDNAKWEYMNGGVHGHAAGELARGAFEHGYEAYGVDILRRVNALGQKLGRVMFAWTGAIEGPKDQQVFTPISLAQQANMDIAEGGQGALPWLGNDKDPGNDISGLPTGQQTYGDAPFEVAVRKRVAIGVSANGKLPERLTVPVNRTAGAVYLLHTAGAVGGSGNAALMELEYDDGSRRSIYIRSGEHLAGWWYPSLKKKHAGVAWRGPNAVSSDVGVSWCAIANPEPQKQIRAITFSAAADGAIYALLGLTLASRMPWVAPELGSYGGPDNWSGGLCMAALVEGLAGIKDTGAAYSRVRLSPRWTAADVTDAQITARYPASKGYVTYHYRHDASAKRITLALSTSANEVTLRLLLPQGATTAKSLTLNAKPVATSLEQIEQSRYAVTTVEPIGVCAIELQYA